jgi:alkylmercury lyase
MADPSSEKSGSGIDLEEIVEAWVESRETKYATESVTVTDFVLRSIASGRAIGLLEFVEETGLTLREAKLLFRKMRLSGADFDEEGRLIGNALTLRPTQNLLKIDGRMLYAWCALDTLFLPGLIGKTAEVRSRSPVTGELINLSVSPSGIETFYPASTVLSVVVPGKSKACEPGQRGGLQGAVCSSMHFFTSHEEAEGFLGKDSDVAILAVEEASELAQRAWVRPYRSALKSTNGH